MTITIYRRTHTHYRRPILTKQTLSPLLLLFSSTCETLVCLKSTYYAHISIWCMNQACMQYQCYNQLVRKPSTRCNHCPQLLPLRPAPSSRQHQQRIAYFVRTAPAYSSQKDQGLKTVTLAQKTRNLFTLAKRTRSLFILAKRIQDNCAGQKDPWLYSVQRTQTLFNLSKGPFNLAKGPRNYLSWPKDPKLI